MPGEVQTLNHLRRNIYEVEFELGRTKAVIASTDQEAVLIAMQHHPESDKVKSVTLEGVARISYYFSANKDWDKNIIDFR